MATCRDIRRQFGRLWTYLEVEGVELTDNEPERVLRDAVIARGPMLSSKSEARRILFTRLMSVSATFSKQGRNLLGYLRMALEQYAPGLSPPSLVPNYSTFRLFMRQTSPPSARGAERVLPQDLLA